MSRRSRGNPLLGSSDADLRYLTPSAGDQRYQTGALSPLYGHFMKEAYATAGRCDVVMVGDSIAEGFGSDLITNRWVDQAQAKLRTTYTTGTQGPGWIPATYASNNNTGTLFTSWAYTGTTAATAHGIGFKSKQLMVGATATITKTCTSFKLFFKRNSADVVTITIDGGAATTFTMNTGVSAQTWTSPALTAGSHTVVVTATAGGPSFCGAMFYNGDETAGLAIWDGSHSGSRMSDFSTTNLDWYNHLPLIAPSLLVLTCITNDCRTSSSGYDSTTFYNNAQSIITQARAKVANLPVLLMPPYQALGTLIEPWTNYTAKLTQLAAANTYTAVYDISNRIPSLASDPYSFLNDGIHPKAIGHALMGSLCSRALSPA